MQERFGVNFYSIENVIALGKQMAQVVERQARIVDDPIVSEYVNRIGQNLVRNSDAKVPFTIKVIDSEEINAFALPGGFFFVNTGILLNADNEAEMAGVMAHEIGHVAARHGTRQATRGEIAQIGSIVPLIAVDGMAGYGIYQAMGLVVPMGFLLLSRSRSNFEADSRHAREYMNKMYKDPATILWRLLREGLSPGKALKKRKLGNDVEAVLFASADRRPHQALAGDHPEVPQSEAGIRGQHERV